MGKEETDDAVEFCAPSRAMLLGPLTVSGSSHSIQLALTTVCRIIRGLVSSGYPPIPFCAPGQGRRVGGAKGRGEMLYLTLPHPLWSFHRGSMPTARVQSGDKRITLAWARLLQCHNQRLTESGRTTRCMFIGSSCLLWRVSEYARGCGRRSRVSGERGVDGINHLISPLRQGESSDVGEVTGNVTSTKDTFSYNDTTKGELLHRWYKYKILESTDGLPGAFF